MPLAWVSILALDPLPPLRARPHPCHPDPDQRLHPGPHSHLLQPLPQLKGLDYDALSSSIGDGVSATAGLLKVMDSVPSLK